MNSVQFKELGQPLQSTTRHYTTRNTLKQSWVPIAIHSDLLLQSWHASQLYLAHKLYPHTSPSTSTFMPLH